MLKLLGKVKPATRLLQRHDNQTCIV